MGSRIGAEPEVLKAVARQRVVAVQDELGLGVVGAGLVEGPSRTGNFGTRLPRACDTLGFVLTGGGTRCSGSAAAKACQR